MIETDVIVVGGGPIGGFVAGQIASKKYNVIILEGKKEIGLPINCAGLVSERIFDILEISKQSIVQNKIKGANIHSPSNKILGIGGNNVHALVINRCKFDKEIIKKSQGKGAELLIQNKVLSAQRNKDHIEIKTSKDTDLKCNLLIGADGPYSKIRDRFSFSEPKEFLRGIGAEMENVNLDPDFVEIFVGNETSPGFFAWIIPTNKKGTKARIGLCINMDDQNPPKYYFEKFLSNKNVYPFLEDANIVQNIGGIIPLGMLKQFYDSNVMLVGDAAAQVKPTSGGGIYPGLLCGKYCSQVAIDALENELFTAQSLKKYQKLCYKDIGKELTMGFKFRSIFKNLSDKQMDYYIEKFQNRKIIDLINRYGDIDYPSKLIKPLLKKLPFLIKLIPSMLK